MYVSIEKCELNALMYMKGLSTSVEVYIQFLKLQSNTEEGKNIGSISLNKLFVCNV